MADFVYPVVNRFDCELDAVEHIFSTERKARAFIRKHYPNAVRVKRREWDEWDFGDELWPPRSNGNTVEIWETKLE